ncbi:MAG: flagellin [Alphaproteobacteria bacterium]|nr:flagellin [Alphaproteobacteria bacterium]
MANSIISNIAAFNAQGNINRASSSASSSIARLSSGNRITQASDDVAGLATGTALRTQVTTLRTALANAAQGTSLLQVADGSLSQIVDILQRQKAIAVQASSGQLTDSNRALLNQEFSALTSEIDRIAASTNFNGVGLLNGGLGTSTTLFNLDATAVKNTVLGGTITGSAVGTTVAAVSVIEAYNTQTGAATRGVAAAGSLNVTDSGGTLLTNAQFANVNSSLSGGLSNFKISDVVIGVSATFSVDIGGLTYTGNYVNAATSVLVSNGNTFVNLGVAAIGLTSVSDAETGIAAAAKAFANTSIFRNLGVTGVDFTGTRLAGVTGTAADIGIAGLRLSSSDAVISNFQYAGNTGAANTSRITVDINGQQFVATGVKDAIATGTGRIAFQSADAQTFVIDLAGLTTAFTNIRTDAIEQAALINALNQGFSRAGSGLNFSVGSAATDSIKVSLSSAGSTSLYNGATLDVTSSASAAAASLVLDAALNTATSLRASVGALQSRFNFASNAIQSSIENQDSARSSLLDTDVSSESTAFSSAQVQLQAGIAVLAQANQLPQSLLKLLN